MIYNKERHDLEKQLLTELMEEKKLSVKTMAKSLALHNMLRQDVR